MNNQNENPLDSIFEDWSRYFGIPSQQAHVIEGEVIDIDCEVIEDKKIEE